MFLLKYHSNNINVIFENHSNEINVVVKNGFKRVKELKSITFEYNVDE
jgi:hypothetical protein